jgi:hypothetical protein
MESWAVAHDFGSDQIKDHLIPILFDWTRKITSYNDIDTIESDYHGNYQNIVFICLQQWRLKRLGGTLVDIKIALEEEAQNTHILCKVRILAVFQVYRGLNKLYIFNSPSTKPLEIKHTCV